MRIVKLAHERIDEAAAVLARAFQDDPLCVYTQPNGSERARVLPEYFKRVIRSGLLVGEVYVTEGAILGVAVWWSLFARFSREKMQAAGLGETSSLFGAEAYQRYSRVVSCEWQSHQGAISGEHWYLLQLGVEPAHQGQGLGGELIAPGRAAAQAENLPCYVETEQPRNVPFYLKQGFELAVEQTEPSSGLRFWGFAA